MSRLLRLISIFFALNHITKPISYVDKLMHVVWSWAYYVPRLICETELDWASLPGQIAPRTNVQTVFVPKKHETPSPGAAQPGGFSGTSNGIQRNTSNHPITAGAQTKANVHIRCLSTGTLIDHPWKYRLVNPSFTILLVGIYHLPKGSAIF